MNLQDLTPKLTSTGVASQLKKQFGKEYQVDSMNLKESKALLDRTNTLMAQYKKANTVFESESDPRYMKLLLLRDAASKRISEISESQKIMKSDYVKALRHVAGGGTLSEAQLAKLQVSAGLKRVLENRDNAIMFIKRIVENKRTQGRQLNEAEIDSAQVVLAAQDIADQIQTMIEKFADIQYKELPALKDGIRKEMGVETAESFDSSVQSSIQSLTGALETAKNDISNAVAGLTGEEMPGPNDLDVDGMGDELDMGMDDGMGMDDEMGMGGDDELDMDMELDLGGEEDEDLADLGREKREI